MPVKISDLPAAGSLAETDVVPGVNASTTVKMTLTAIGNLITRTVTGFLPAGSGGTAQSVQARLRKTVLTSDYDTLANAITAAASSVLVINTAITVASNLTIASTVKLTFAPEGQLTVNSGVTLTINGFITAAPDQQIFAGTGTLVIAKATNPEVWAHWFVGGDMGLKINAARAAISPGGTIKLLPGTHTVSTQIDLSSTTGVRLIGSGGNQNASNPPGTVLSWSLTTAANAIKLDGAASIEIAYLGFQTNNTMTGSFIDTATTDASDVHIHHCAFIGGTLTKSCIDLDVALNWTIEECFFRYCEYHVRFEGSSNNAVNIRKCWFDSTCSVSNIILLGSSISIDSNVFESTVKPILTMNGTSNNLGFTNNWAGDAGAVAITLIDLSQYILTGGLIANNFLAINHASSICILFKSANNNTRGVRVTGNHFSGTGTAVHLGASEACSVEDNYINCTIPLEGSTGSNNTGPVKWSFKRNSISDTPSGTYTNIGVSLANNAIMPIAPNRGAITGGLKGAGYVNFYITLDSDGSIQAIGQFCLLPNAPSTAEIRDEFTNMANAKGTASSFNVYYDTTDSYSGFKLQNLSGNAVRVIVDSFSPV